MFKRILSLVLAVLMIASMSFAFASCDGGNEGNGGDDFKIGFICLHDETSTYDKNFIDAALAAKASLGLSDDQVIIKKNIPEGSECYDAAKDLVDSGCKVIFANSFGHESFLLQAAKENPNVQFCHATGTMAHTENLSNFQNAFASIYEGRFLAGVAAGMKLNELKAEGKLKGEVPKIGYVGAYPYAEVKSGYTAFYLGAKYVCPEVIMSVKFTNEWYHVDKEKNAAEALIAEGCDLISQHADSMGAPGACEAAGIPNVSYNGSTAAACPNTFIISSRIDWQPYFELIVNYTKEGKDIPADWCGGIENGSVKLTELGTKAPAAGTAEKIAEIKAKILSGEIKVFDLDTFKVNGEKLTTYMADVDTDAAFTPDTEAIKDGYFAESTERSAPYFDVTIDGITLP